MFLCCYLRVDLAGQLQSPQVGGVSHLVLLHRVIGEAQTTRLGSVHHPRREDQLLRQRDPDGPGETLRPACMGRTGDQKN